MVDVLLLCDSASLQAGRPRPAPMPARVWARFCRQPDVVGLVSDTMRQAAEAAAAHEEEMEAEKAGGPGRPGKEESALDEGKA